MPAELLLEKDRRRVEGLAPIVDARTRVLILGSMPGETSLGASEYYAHSRNCFWRIVRDVLEIEASLPYTDRIDQLRRAGVGLWDVLASCQRQGSLDSSIDPGSIVVNDIAGLLESHPRIERLLFNGTFAGTVFKRHIEPRLLRTGLPSHRLPSTSPANASSSYEQKLQAWRPMLLVVP